MIFIDDLNDPRLKRVSTETYKETVWRVSMIKILLERDRAVKALTNAGFQDLGGEAWKPPVNEYATLYHQNRREFEGLVTGLITLLNEILELPDEDTGEDPDDENIR